MHTLAFILTFSELFMNALGQWLIQINKYYHNSGNIFNLSKQNFPDIDNNKKYKHVQITV